ncbi:EamA family transporter [Gemella sp. GH3]|nr:EamA family transporter [Gemella sp. GH3.1]NYS50731.1 EamA family transporter [Gemella sp. GH3]
MSQQGIVMTFLGATFWGLSGVGGEYLLNVSRLDSTWLISNRLFYSGLIMIILLYLKNKDRIFEIFSSKTDSVSLLYFAFCGLLVCQATYFMAIKYTNAGTATVLQYLGPLIIMGYYCFYRKKFSKVNELLAILLSLIGTIIIVSHFNFESLSISKEGLFWGIFSAIGLATYNILSIKLISKYGAMLTVGWAMFLSGVIVQIFTKSFYIPQYFGIKELIAFIVVVLFGTILSFTFYLHGVQLIGAVRGSIIACFEPIAAIIFSVLLIGTKFNFYDILGSFFILIGVVILNRN